MSRNKSESNNKFEVVALKLPNDLLPSNKQILEAIYFEKGESNLKFADAIKSVAQQTYSLWREAAYLPVIAIKSVIDRMNKLHLDFRKVAASHVSRPDYVRKVESFKVKSVKNCRSVDFHCSLRFVAFQMCFGILFDICSCRCDSFKYCDCSKDRKVSVERQRFLIDQRNQRRLKIPNTKVLSIPPNVIPSGNTNNTPKSSNNSDQKNQHVSTDSNHVLRSGKSINTNVEPVSTVRNNIVLAETAKVADRLRLSNGAVAMISSAVLVDFNMIDGKNRQFVIDRSKVWRNRHTQRKSATKAHDGSIESIQALYFDGRGDQTKVMAGNKIRIEKREHISMIQEPGSKYLNHITVESTRSEDVCRGIVQFFETNEIDTDDIVAVGCDGCNTNTGWESGALVRLERKLGRPLQWFVCLLHFDELPLRSLITKHDGRTTGPDTFSGIIGKRVQGCEELPIVGFNRIEFRCNVKNLADIANSLSTDQRYLFNICNAISNGDCSRLAEHKPGKVGHARWITMASRICRLYVSTPRPSDYLIILVKYVLWVYAPAHFQIKYQSSCLFGSLHLWNIIQASKFLEINAKHRPYLTTVRDSIQRNAFFAHPENLMLAMLNDESQDVRLRGWQKILEIRDVAQASADRVFKIPRINFDARSYIEMIDWESVTVSEPPVLRGFPVYEENIVELSEKKISEHELGIDVYSLPCHTQAVERTVKLVTEASQNVFGQEQRHGYILNTLNSRTKLPNFQTKSDFNV